MLEDDTKPRTLPKAGHVCPAPLLQGPFPRCRRGSALGSGSEAADEMPTPIKPASAAVLHLTFPREFTFLSSSPPLPWVFESLSLQEKDEWVVGRVSAWTQSQNKGWLKASPANPTSPLHKAAAQTSSRAQLPDTCPGCPISLLWGHCATLSPCLIASSPHPKKHYLWKQEINLWKFSLCICSSRAVVSPCHVTSCRELLGSQVCWRATNWSGWPGTTTL